MGVCIGDTAGLADTNEFVVNNTVNYLAHAGVILLVAPVLRIADLEHLDAQLSRSISLGKANSTYLIATKTDLLKTTLKSADRKRLSVEDAARIEPAEALLRELEEESEKLKREKQHLFDTQQWQQYGKFDEDPNDLKGRKASAEREKIRSIRHISQRKIALEVKDMFRRLTRSGHGPDLKVHFTTTEGLDDHYRENGNIMSVDDLLDTGVPAIAELLLERPARERFDVLWRACTKRLPSDFQAIIKMLTKTLGQMHQDVRASIVQKFDAGIEHVIKALQDELNCRFTEQLAKIFTDDNKSDWCTKSDPKIDKWASWHARSVHASCKRGGFWRPTTDTMSKPWSFEIQNIFATTVAKAFERIDADCVPVMESLTNNIKDFILQPLKDDPSITSLGQEGSTLAQTIASQSDEVDTDLRDLGGQLKDFLELVCRRAAFNDAESYVHEELKPTYLQAAALCQKDYSKISKKSDRLVVGKSALADRIHALRTKICQKGPSNIFERVQTRTENGLEEVSKEWARHVRKRLEAMRTAVLEDFDESHEETARMDSTAATAILEAAKLAQSRLKNEVLPLLEECKKLDDKVAKVEAMED
ncbi:hypothetical protein BST61_g9850 [Cercospora zeina]